MGVSFLSHMRHFVFLLYLKPLYCQVFSFIGAFFFSHTKIDSVYIGLLQCTLTYFYQAPASVFFYILKTEINKKIIILYTKNVFLYNKISKLFFKV